MLKFIFICLMIANGFLFALLQGYFASPLAETHQPQRLLQQQQSEHLKLISAQEAALPGNGSSACLKWGSFTISELAKVDARLNVLEFENRPVREPAQEGSSTIVYIPPLGSKAAAEKKATELTRLGVEEFFIIQDNSSGLRWGISLGIFKSEEAAKQLLASLISKGVRSAKLGERTGVTNKFNLVFKDVSSSEKAGLDNLKTEFPAQDLHVCK